MGVSALLILEPGGPFPLAQVDVLGASVAERIADSLLAAGVKEISVLSGYGQADAPHFKSPKIRYVKSSGQALWGDARRAYEALAEGGPEAVLLIRLNSYGEIDWANFFARHRVNGERVTRAWQSLTEPLDIYLVDPRFRKDAEFLFHSRLRHPRLPATRYHVSESEYVHWLHSVNDLREITLDALHLRCQMRPAGREVRPGVWMAAGSRVDAGVRLVAPLFVGKHARIRTGAVITRGSSLEHHSSVDCGTVIENTSVLPFAAVGAGLDLAHAVVGSRQVFDLKRNVAVEIHDPTLVDEVLHNAGVRVLAKAAALATYLPMQFWRGLTQRAALPELAAADACSADLAASVLKEKRPATRALRPELVMERYGNQ